LDGALPTPLDESLVGDADAHTHSDTRLLYLDAIVRERLLVADVEIAATEEGDGMLSPVLAQFPRLNFPALSASLGVSLIAVAAFLLYGKAFRTTPDPGISLGYLFRLGTNPWFIAGIFTGFLAVFVRMYVFSLVGIQRAWFLSGVAFILNSSVIMAALHAEMTPVQWVGVLAIALGVTLVATE